MKQFTVKSIKEKFIKKQVETNWDHVAKRIQENKSLLDTFSDFAQEEGFLLASTNSAPNEFSFFAYLFKDSNAEDNDGQIVFIREDFQDAKEKLQQSLTSKSVSVKKKSISE